MNEAGDPPFRPPPERRAWPAIVWIAATLAAIAALVVAWDPPTSSEAAAVLAMPSLPSLPDPAAAASDPTHEDANSGLPPTAASGTELIEVCGVGWVPPDASGAADRAAVSAEPDVLASQRALLDALRRRDGEVGDAMATVLELQGAGRDSAAGTPLQALMLCNGPTAASSIATCAGRNDDRQRAAALVEQLARRASATTEPRVYALAIQQCQWTKGQGSCALLNVDQWARVDDGNALPWLYVLQRARDRNDPAQIEEALHHIGAAARFEAASYAIAGRVADLAGAGDVDAIGALLVAVDAVNIAASRIDPYAALNNVCKGASLADANRRQECERAAETLTDRSDSPMAVLAGAEIGRAVGWPAERVEALRRLANSSSAMDEANPRTLAAAELPSSCRSARRILASFSRKAKEGEVQAVRAWLAANGGSPALVAGVPSQSASASSDEAAHPAPDAAQAVAESASAALPAVAVAPPVAPPASSSAPVAPAPEAAASATPYSATPPPDR